MAERRYAPMPSPSLTRRQILRGAAAGIATAAAGPGRGAGAAARVTAQREGAEPYTDDVLPAGVRSRFVGNVNGLRMHVLEAGSRVGARAGVLLLHGFPELAYSWRRVLPVLAAAGYHVIAPDLRGYGRTDGTGVGYDDDLRPFRMLNEVRDMLALVSAFGYRDIHIVGHDFGSLVASWCAVARPDVFRSVVLMSAPFGGTAALPFDTADAVSAPADLAAAPDINDELGRLTPPRKHYRRFYATRAANDDMWRAPQGVHAFLRAYYHMKSADWSGNRPQPLRAWSAAELARHPPYQPVVKPRKLHGGDRRVTCAVGWRRSRRANGCPTTIGAFVTEEQRRQTGCSANRMQRGFYHGLLLCDGVRQGHGGDRRASLPARATGAFTSARARSSGWRRAPAPTCGVCTCSTGRGTGRSRSSQRPSAGWWSNFWARSDGT